MELIEHPAVAGSGPGPPALGQEVAPGMPGQEFQPGPEATARVVDEGAELDGEQDQDLLGNILGVGLLEAPPPAPGQDPRPVPADEVVPGRWVVGRAPEAAQQAGSRP